MPTPGESTPDVDVVAAEYLGRSDAGQLEELGCVERAAREDDLLGGGDGV